MRFHYLGILCLLLFVSCVCLSCSALKPSLKTDASPVFKGRDSQVKNATQQKKSLSDRQTKTAENSRGGELQAPLKQEIQQLNAEMDRIIQGSRQKYQKRHIVSSQDNGTSSDFQDISFNFYDAELTEVVKVVMDLLGANYIFHPDVAGRVSLSVKDTFNNAQLRDLLQGVLHINNLVMVNKDKVWHIMPLAEAPSYVAEERIIFPQEELKPQRGQYIQAFRLHFIAASELIKIIKPYLTQNAQVYAHEQKGILLVCDFPHVLTKVKRLIPLFDESVFADKKAKVYALQYTKAEDVVEKLTSISKEFGLSPEEGSPKSRVSFLPLERLNMVLVIAGDKRVIEFVDAWVHQLDTEIPQSLIQEYGQNIYVYYVQYGRAENIVESLKGVFEEGAREDDEDQKYVSKERTKGPEEQTRQKSQMGSESVSGELTGEVTFMIDETTNSILTKCSSHDYDKILSVIEKLDLYPKQVLIEVLIAEVTLNESTKFGFEWEYLTNLHGDTESIIQVDSGLGFIGEKTRDINKGLTYLVTDTDKITAALRASEEEDNVNILSRPTLLASDNQEAEINIGDEVPIPTTSEVREDDTGTAKTTETTIQYRDTGIIMRVTPHINKQGMVRMELSQEVSNLSKQTVEGVDAPVISTRNAQTTVAVNDGQTVIIGGLMEQTQSSGASGIPYLSRMPFLKYAFGYERSSFSNTELIILITPHVVLNEEDSNVVSKEFVSRVESIKQLMR